MNRFFYTFFGLFWSWAVLQAQSGPKYGLIAGFESQILGIQTLDSREPSRSAVQARNGSAGVSIGVFGRWPLFQNVFVQPELLLAYAPNRVSFRDEGIIRYPFWDIEIPLHFVLSSPKNSFPLRPSFLFGGRMGWNMAPHPTTNLYFLRERVSLDIGMGLEFRVKGILVCPELIYAHGMNNIHNFYNTKYDWIVGRAVRDRLSLRLYFVFDGRDMDH